MVSVWCQSNVEDLERIMAMTAEISTLFVL